MEKKCILIDSDTGTDDAMAIMMAIAAHKDPTSPVQVVGIISAHGNTTAENAARNAIRTLQSVQEEDIPVFIGSTASIVRPFDSPLEPFHGLDGFGDFSFPNELNHKETSNYKREHGVLAMCRLAKEYEGKLTVLALAPLTNLAMAARLDPEICNRLEAIYMMGGNIEGEGNVTVSAEYNFAVDPEAACITLTSFTCPMFLVPWEVTLRAAIPIEWRVKVLGGVDSPQAKLLNAVEKKILEENIFDSSWIACDQFAAAAAIEPKVMLKTVKRYCTVELGGNFARGLMIVDKMGILKQPPNLTIIEKLDEDLCKEMMLCAVGGCKHYAHK